MSGIPEAIIDPSAKIGRDVEIGPWSIIGPDVEIGDGCKIASHVIIKSHSRIGKNNQFFQFSSIGEDPSDKKYHGEVSWLEMGDNNIVREGVTIHRGTESGGGITRIGSGNLFMPYAHIAHDCMVGDNTIFSNNSAISGHVEVGDWAILSGYAGVYQFLKVGAHSFIGGLTHVNMDVPAYVMVKGNPPTPKGINITGLERRGFDKKTIQVLRKAYKMIYREGLKLEEAMGALDEMSAECEALSLLVNSLRASEKGILR